MLLGEAWIRGHIMIHFFGVHKFSIEGEDTAKSYKPTVGCAGKIIMQMAVGQLHTMECYPQYPDVMISVKMCFSPTVTKKPYSINLTISM